MHHERRLLRIDLDAAVAFALDEAPATTVVALCAALGAFFALHVFGKSYLLGTSDYWSYPPGDAGTIVTGWNYFVHHGWRFPIGTAFGTNGATGANLVFFDAIPLVALVGKALRPILGTSWHPYGIWHLAIYVLQAVLGALLARRLGMRGLFAGLAAAVICLTSAWFLLRFYQESLNGQFVVLWALLNYARSTPETPRRPLAIGWAAGLCRALLVTPYLLAMIVPIAIAAHARLARSDRRSAAISAASSIASLVVVWFVVGYSVPFPTKEEAGVYGMSSTNLMSLVVPFYSSVFTRLPERDLQEATGLQWDAHAFLGVAVIPMVAIALVFNGRAMLALVRRHWMLCAALALLALYAPGPRWYFGQHRLFEVPTGREIEHALSIFRATGYALAFGAAMLVVRRFGRRGTIGFAALALVQLYDSSASAAVARDATARPQAHQADWTAWSALLAPYDKVSLYPSWLCWGKIRPPESIRNSEREIEFIAAARGMRSNHACTGRALTDCSPGIAYIPSIKQKGMKRGTLYVFLRPAYTAEMLDGLAGCREIPDGWACSVP